MKALVYCLLVSLIGLMSCDSVFNSNPKSKEFEYYQPGYALSKNSQLRTKSFYYTPTGVYSYLKFYNDGFVHHLGGTALEPDSVHIYNYMNIGRKKNGEPIDNKVNWGYCRSSEDSLFFTIVKHRGMSSIIHKYVGVIIGDTLFFQTYKESVASNGEMVKDCEEKYVYYNPKN